MTLKASNPNLHTRHKAGILPPWLWFWLVLYLLNLPRLVSTLWQANIQPLISPEPLAGDAGGKAISAIIALPSIAELLPVVMLLLGVIFVLLPKLRQTQVERKYKLQKDSLALPIIQEIAETIKSYAPDIEIKTNLLRSDQFAFVYPTGYRKSAIAIFGGLIKLWRADKEAGKAVLLHELAHYRHGDVLIVGTGSFFETLLSSWLRFLFRAPRKKERLYEVIGAKYKSRRS